MSDLVLAQSAFSFDTIKSHADWMERGKLLAHMERHVQFAIGDWLNFGREKYKHGKYDEGLELFRPLKLQTMRLWAHISSAYEPLIRINGLTFKHHQIAAPLEMHQREDGVWVGPRLNVLRHAAAEEWTTAQLSTHIRDMNTAEPGPLPEGKYRVILADPPWTYGNSGFDQSASSKYPTMETDDICALPVADMATEETTLLLWATSPLLPDALRVIDAWGATYKASMVWVKNKAPGMGWFVETRHEFLMIASYGTVHPSEKVNSVITADVRGHSAKPSAVHIMAETCYHGPRVELFCRTRRPDWEAWGDQA